jgi:hypothetical protein
LSAELDIESASVDSKTTPREVYPARTVSSRIAGQQEERKVTLTVQERRNDLAIS